MIICGDFGGVFSSKPCKKEFKNEKYWLDWLSEKPITFIVVPGNHENYDAVETNYPLDYFKGAKARYIRRNIIWIERGEILRLGDKRFWCFGGAFSIDKEWRTPNINWWDREQPTPEETFYAEENFDRHKDSIDFIITHDVPSSVVSIVFNNKGYASITERFLERILWKMDTPIPWFSGHLHKDIELENNFTILYNDIKQII